MSDRWTSSQRRSCANSRPVQNRSGCASYRRRAAEPGRSSAGLYEACIPTLQSLAPPHGGLRTILAQRIPWRHPRLSGVAATASGQAPSIRQNVRFETQGLPPHWAQAHMRPLHLYIGTGKVPLCLASHEMLVKKIPRVLLRLLPFPARRQGQALVRWLMCRSRQGRLCPWSSWHRVHHRIAGASFATISS
jgi:hypothetical protein